MTQDNLPGKCDACGKEPRCLTKLDSGQLVCRTCLQEIRPPRPKDLAPLEKIVFLRSNGLTVSDDLTRIEAKRLCKLLTERKWWPALPEATPMELLRELGDSRYDEMASGDRNLVASARRKILDHAKISGAECRSDAASVASVRHLFTKLVGVTHANRDGSSRQDNLSFCENGDAVALVEDAYNEHSSHAVAVIKPPKDQLGFLPDEVAQRVVAEKDEGSEHAAFIAEIGCGSGGMYWATLLVLIFDDPDSELSEVLRYMKEVIPPGKVPLPAIEFVEELVKKGEEGSA